MANHRFSDGKNYFKPNKYKADLTHQRAMRAKDNHEPVRHYSSEDDRFISSRRVDQVVHKSAMEEKRQSFKELPLDDNFDVIEDVNYKKAKKPEKVEKPSQSYTAQNKYSKPSGISVGTVVTIVIASILILCVLGFVVWCILDVNGNNTQNATENTVSTETTAPQETQPTTVAAVFSVPMINDDNSDGEFENGYYIWNESIFKLYDGDDDTASNYAEAINRYSAELGSDIKTYAMIIPSHIEMGLPTRFLESGEVETVYQASNINIAYKLFDDTVTAINCYNNLANHCNDYIYFTTENYWTALGAYYGYSAFAETTGQQVLDINNCTEHKIEGYYGQLTQDVEKELPADTVSYYELPYDTTNEVYEESDGEAKDLSTYYTAAERGTLTYGVFLWGDNPLCVLKADNNTGKKIAVVKDPNGNCFVPYLTYNYDEVHVIDYMLYEGKLKDYCEENDISEVLFVNGIHTANSSRHVKAMDTLFGENQN